MFNAQKIIDVCLTSFSANPRVKDRDWSLVDLSVNDFSVAAHCASLVSHKSNESRTLRRQSERDRNHRIIWSYNPRSVLR